MNTHDIELPPLPDLPAYSSEVFDREVKVVSETMAEQLMHDYARAAIEPYQQRIEELESQLEAIGAGGVSSQRITSQRGGEPVACFKCGHAKHGGECVNVAPQPAEPVKVPSEDERAAQGLPPYSPRHLAEEEWNRLTENGRRAWGKQPAEPTNKHSLSVAETVKVPSDEELYALAESMGAVIACNGAGDYNDNVDSVVNYARALLARYGQTTEPEGWRLVPKELIDFLDAKEHHLPVEDRHVLSVMLAAAPEPPCTL